VTAAHYDDYLLLDVADLVKRRIRGAQRARLRIARHGPGVMSGPVIDVKSLH